MDHHNELKWISNLLKEKGIGFWLDSGTLLGLVREGKILEGDKDIDLGMWAEQEPLLKKALPQVEEKGYKIYTTNYRGLNFKYRFIPTSEDSRMEIDINLFRKYRERAWCPQVYRIESPFSKKNPLYYIVGLPRYIIQMRYKRKRHVEVNRWPWSITYKVYSWWVPARYYECLKKIEQGYPVPQDTAGYLEFRYGRWQVPNRAWFFFTDDGAIRYVKPEALVNVVNRT